MALLSVRQAADASALSVVHKKAAGFGVWGLGSGCKAFKASLF